MNNFENYRDVRMILSNFITSCSRLSSSKRGCFSCYITMETPTYRRRFRNFRLLSVSQRFLTNLYIGGQRRYWNNILLRMVLIATALPTGSGPLQHTLLESSLSEPSLRILEIFKCGLNNCRVFSSIGN